MRQHPRFSVLAVVSLGLFFVYLWTLTESVTATIRVADGRCTAELYGRASAIDCPGLTGGALATMIGDPTGRVIARGPLGLLLPAASWSAVGLIGADDQTLPAGAPLPAAFDARVVLRHPDSPGGVILRHPNGRTGWVFLIDTDTRRGAWWEWAGKPTVPLQGIPLDRPFGAQAQSLVRRLLDGWQGALLLAAAVWVVAVLGRSVKGPRRHSPPTTRHSSLVVRHSSLLLVLFTFGVALHVAVDVLARLPHVQDSVTYLFQSQTLAAGHLTAPAPPLSGPDAAPHFAQEFLLVRDGRWFGKYPPGYPALLAPGVLAGAPWLVNPLLAALTVALVSALARRLGNYELRTTNNGLRGRPAVVPLPLTTDHWPLITVYWPLTTLLLATSPFFLVMSGSFLAHPAELFWTVLFMLAWVRALPPRPRANGRHRRWAIAAGLAFGALFLTRQITAVTIGLAFGGGWLAVLWWAAGRPPTADRRGRRLGLPGDGRWTTDHGLPARQSAAGRLNSGLLTTDLLNTLLLFGLAAVPLVLALPAYQAAVTGDARTDPRLLFWPYDRVGFGPGIGESPNAFTLSLTEAGPAIAWFTDPAEPPRGHSPARGLYNLGRNLEALQAALFGWPPLLALAFVWLAFLLRRPSIVDWLLLAVALAVAGGYVAYWATGIAYGPRYFYAALPVLALLTARGAAALAAVGGRWVAVILVLLIGYNLLRLPAHVADYRDYNFVSAEPRQAVEAAVTTPALVFVTASEVDWWEYGAFFSGNTPWLDGPVIYARDLGPDENSRLWSHFADRRAYLWRDGQLTEWTGDRGDEE